ncbi:MAG: DUF4145 domain-containing protein [Bryobacteraceae bacterium]
MSLLRCTVCGSTLVAFQSLIRYAETLAGDIEEWTDATRVWPQPQSELSTSIPKKIRDCLDEARKCLHTSAYIASVAMSGRALEAIARHFHSKGKADRLMLAQGLKDLHEEKVIDDRLLAWGRELHEHRNLAAHASDATFDQWEAQDLYDFAVAICDYVFVMADKYDQFIQRKVSRHA